MSFAERLIQLEGLLGVDSCQRKRLFGRRRRKFPQQTIRLGQTGVGQAISRVFIDCLLEILDALVETVFSEFVPIETSPEIKLISRAVLCVRPDKTLLLLTRQLQPQLVRNLPRDLLLHLKQIALLAIVVLLAPDA